jgi:hypothetical protein
MQKLLARAAVAICALGIGVALSHFAHNLPYFAHNYGAAEVAPEDIPAVNLRMRQNADGWKRIDIAGKFSFYLPPTMRPIEHHRVYNVQAGSFGDAFVRINYAYFQGHSCPSDRDFKHRPDFQALQLQTSQLVIDGREASLLSWHDVSHPQYLMTLCFADIGDQTRLHLGAASNEAQAMQVARRIFDSLEFH